MWNASGVDFVAYLPFYPDCATTYRDDTLVVARPIRIFHGTPDNYNPVRTCRAYVQRLKDAKADVELIEYPNAQHGFDGPPGANPPVPAARDQSVRECTIREGDNGILINQATGAQSLTRTNAFGWDLSSATIPKLRSGLPLQSRSS